MMYSGIAGTDLAEHQQKLIGLLWWQREEDWRHGSLLVRCDLLLLQERGEQLCDAGGRVSGSAGSEGCRENCGSRAGRREKVWEEYAAVEEGRPITEESVGG